MIEHDSEYYTFRHQRELEQAERAADPAIAGIHRYMAERYAVLASEQQTASADVLANA